MTTLCIKDELHEIVDRTGKVQVTMGSRPPRVFDSATNAYTFVMSFKEGSKVDISEVKTTELPLQVSPEIVGLCKKHTDAMKVATEIVKKAHNKLWESVYKAYPDIKGGKLELDSEHDGLGIVILKESEDAPGFMEMMQQVGRSMR